MENPGPYRFRMVGQGCRPGAHLARVRKTQARPRRRALWLSALVLTLAAAACVPISQPPPGPPPPPDPHAATGAWSGPVASGGTVMQHAVLLPGTS